MVRPTLFTTYGSVQRAVRDGRWKLIRYPQINRTQLFDLESDPEELRDLSPDATQAERVERLMAALAGWQKDLGDALPLTSDNPKPAAFTPPME
jgi:arylsulfatase A-like enzyme